MLVLGAAKTTTAVITAVLALSSVRNVFQTITISRTFGEVSSSTSLLPTFAEKGADVVVEELKTLKRKDLLRLFLECAAPSDVSVTEGHWDGQNLDNNGVVMTSVSGFLTTLFGMGRTWNGKAFLTDKDGINRFNSKGDNVSIETEHRFDYSIRSSGLGDGTTTSLVLDYSPYQQPFSLWKTMGDELRVVPVKSGQVLIGLGLMGWSGGILNSSPFCLYRSNRTS